MFATWQWGWSERRADVSLNAAIPWDVEIVGGAGKLQGKFAALDLRSFELTGGVDQLRLTLGRPSGDVPIRLTRGANNIRVERPTGVPVRLRSAAVPGASTSTSSGCTAWATRSWRPRAPRMRPTATRSTSRAVPAGSRCTEVD